tara:strand:- start:1111 stop:2007 length:897 start_codon:yes stop_codon:yes gene_type:complete
MPEEKQKELFEESEDLEIEVEEEKEEEPQEVAAEEPKEQAAESSDDELENYSESVQKRISKLTAKMREAERREKAATEYAQAVQKQLQESTQKSTALDDSFVSEFETRVTYQEESLRNKLKEAIDRGDVDKQVEVQAALANLAQDNQRLAYVKHQKEVQAKQLEQIQQTPQQPVQQAPTQPDPKASAWAERNTWFGQDEPMTLTAFSIHKKLVEEEGYDPTGDEYYNELDSRMRRDFPHKFGEKTNRTSGPAVAGANRSGKTSNKKSVKLTQSQVAIAKKLGITNEQYAKQLLALQNS